MPGAPPMPTPSTPPVTDVTATRPDTDIPPWQVALVGIVAMAVAMGIGRFAFTPLLPMMLQDGVVDLATSSWLASANYLGYLLGALVCTFQPWLWRRLGREAAVSGPSIVRFGLVATAIVTAAMAPDWPAIWPLLRFAAGVASALVFVYISGWCLNRMAQLKVPEMGALIYVGPGAGIVVSGLVASGMVAAHQPAAIGWLVFGVLAAGLTALVWPVLCRSALPASAVTSVAPTTSRGGATRHGRTELALLALAYGLAGLGYIVSATFLPVIARQAIPDSFWLDLFWPIFGLGIMLGALLASRLRSAMDLRLRLLVCYLLQACGVALGLLWPTSAGLALGSLLLGLPMTAITYFAMQEARRLSPAQPASLMGLLTAVYGLGQVVGPPVTAAFLARAASADAGFTQALILAAGALVLGSIVFACMLRRFPLARH